MSEDLTPRQQILLWELMSRGGTAMLQDLRLDNGPKEREKLATQKCIAVTKERHNALRLTLLEGGWNHLASHHPSFYRKGEGSKYDREILQFVLERVQIYAAAGKIVFSDLFRFDRKIEPDAGIEDQIIEAFWSLAGRPARDSVTLTRLRAYLSHIGRTQLDEALKRMRESRQANLISLDNPRDIAAEADAALTIKHDTFHKLWIDP